MTTVNRRAARTRKAATHPREGEGRVGCFQVVERLLYVHVDRSNRSAQGLQAIIVDKAFKHGLKAGQEGQDKS